MVNTNRQSQQVTVHLLDKVPYLVTGVVVLVEYSNTLTSSKTHAYQARATQVTYRRLLCLTILNITLVLPVISITV